MASWLERLLPPTAPPVRGIPKAILKAAVVGVIIGPVLGIFFGWSGPVHAAMVSAVYCVAFYALCALPSGYARDYFREKLSTKARAAVAFANLIGIAAATLVMLAVFEGHPFPIHDLQIPIVLIMIALAWGYVVSARHFVDAETQLASVRAQTRMLRSRMNPHFFFNTLNTISALIPEEPAAAQRMLGLMADISRYVFTGREGEIAPLIEELEFARAYVEIEKIRFGSRLRCGLPGDSEAEGLSIPIFTLQPLIENAVRHGVSKRVGGGSILVRLMRHERRFSLVVENDVEESVSQTHFFQAGHALDNIRERLHLIYGALASIEVTMPQPNFVSVRIEAPVGQAQHSRKS